MKLYKYCNTSHLENLKNDELYFGKVGEVNDKYEGAFIVNISNSYKNTFYQTLTGGYEPIDEIMQLQINNEIIDIARDELFSNTGICCFTTDNKSIKMWGHYADKCRGICLEFESDNSVIANAKQVVYSNDIAIVDIDENDVFVPEFSITTKEKFEKVLYWKNIIWEEESEWRFFGIPNAKFKYEPDALTAIYFGFDVSIPDIKEVFEYTRHLPKIRFYKQLLRRDIYNIEFDEVTEKNLVDSK